MVREIGVGNGGVAREAKRIEELPVCSDTSQTALRNARVQELDCARGEAREHERALSDVGNSGSTGNGRLSCV